MIGTLDERILEGYWYTISWEDLNLPAEERKSISMRKISAMTGKAGVETYINICRKDGMSDELIGESIWLQVELNGISKYVKIKHLTINKA